MDKMLFITSGQLTNLRKATAVALKNVEEVEADFQPVLMQADKSAPKYETLARLMEKISEFKASAALMNQQGREIDQLLQVIGRYPSGYKNGGCYRK